MRDTFLRILIALLIGLWSPMCNCRGAAIMVGEFDAPPVPASAPAVAADDECCEPSPAPDTPKQHEHGPGDGSTCPSCLGPIADAGLRGPVRAIIDLGPTLLFVAVWRPLLPFEIAPDEVTPSVSSGFPLACVRANRVALRWHCALIV